MASGGSGGLDSWPLARRMVPSPRMLAPRVLVAAVLPFVGYLILRPHFRSDTAALVPIMVFPLADITLERVRHGRFEPVGVLSLTGITVGLTGAIAFHGDPTLLKLRESLLTGIFGIGCLASIPTARPAIFLLGRAFASEGDPAAAAQLDALFEQQGAARRFRKLTAVWGIALLAETSTRAAIAVLLPTSVFLALGPFTGWVIIGGLLWYSHRNIHRWEAAGTP